MTEAICPSIKKLSFVIQSHQDKYFYLYLAIDEAADKLRLPERVIDDLSSFGVTYDNELHSSTDIAEAICVKLHSKLVDIWKSEYGIPYFTFEGDTRKLDNRFEKNPVLIFIENEKIHNPVYLEAWKNCCSHLPDVIFLAEPAIRGGFHVVTRDHNFISSWLDQYGRMIKKRTLSNDKYNLRIRMANWYTNKTFRERLICAAKDEIDNFVYCRNIHFHIPEFAIVDAYHAHRFSQVIDIINHKYEPEFIMTLPLKFRGKFYTILFPMAEKTSKGINRC